MALLKRFVGVRFVVQVSCKHVGFSKLIDFYSPWNYQKTYGFLTIRGNWKLINSLNFALIWKQNLSNILSSLTRDLIRTPEIETTFFWVLNNIWTLGWVSNIKFGRNDLMELLWQRELYMENRENNNNLFGALCSDGEKFRPNFLYIWGLHWGG